MYKDCNLCSYGALYLASKLFHYNNWFLCKTSLLHAYVRSVFGCTFQSNRGCAWCSEERTSWCGKFHLSEFIVYLQNTLWMYNLSSEKAYGDISGILQNELLFCHTSPSSICHYCPYNHCQFVIIVQIIIICLPLLSISTSSICHYCPSPNSNESRYIYVLKIM